MGLLQRLKSALGMGKTRRSRRPSEPDVTVEHEPETASERAVKTAVDEEPDEPPAVADAAGDDATDAGTAADAPADTAAATPAESSPAVEEITGIGPTYAERLQAAGIQTVADLAESDVSTIVEAAQATESRAEDWLEQARER